MFTGLVSDVGTLVGAEGESPRRLCVRSSYTAASIPLGASIAHAGVCLTVVDVATVEGGSRFAVELGAETLAVTTLKRFKTGDRINLERPLRVGDELGGHMVSGHVDGVATLVSRMDFNGMAHLRFRAPRSLAKFVATKGSVALDGTSLTINAVEGDEFEVLLIPHTLLVTTWGQSKTGDDVNIEVDQIARYAERLLSLR